MKSDRPDEASTLSLIRENRRLRELVVSLSATLLRTISREAAAGTRTQGGENARIGRRKARNETRSAMQVGTESVPVEG
jgi:hypothetical protein